ncbi:hypothetical protein BJY52DRAFT_1229201 [Lactarius psammicola]|nr:hypothetical protein BJY52DRAFT_1229201 [Lactarius psammicola]
MSIRSMLVILSSVSSLRRDVLIACAPGVPLGHSRGSVNVNAQNLSPLYLNTLRSSTPTRKRSANNQVDVGEWHLDSSIKINTSCAGRVYGLKAGFYGIPNRFSASSPLGVAVHNQPVLVDLLVAGTPEGVTKRALVETANEKTCRSKRRVVGGYVREVRALAVFAAGRILARHLDIDDPRMHELDGPEGVSLETMDGLSEKKKIRDVYLSWVHRSDSIPIVQACEARPGGSILTRVFRDADSYGSWLTSISWGGFTVSLIAEDKVGHFTEKLQKASGGWM